MILVHGPYSHEVNFWSNNPQFSLVDPFSKLYMKDNGGVDSSKVMWCVFFWCDKSKYNLFRAMVPDARELMIKSFHSTFDAKDPVWVRFFKAYESMAMSPAGMSFLLMEKAFEKRSKFLDETDYNIGTAKELDAMHANTGKLVADYRKAREIMYEEDDERDKLHGGGSESGLEGGMAQPMFDNEDL